MKIEPNELAQLRALRRIRNEDGLRLASALIEFEEARDLFRRSIARSKEKEAEIARRFIESRGLDFDAGDYTITEDGEIMTLKAGAWVAVEG